MKMILIASLVLLSSVALSATTQKKTRVPATKDGVPKVIAFSGLSVTVTGNCVDHKIKADSLRIQSYLESGSTSYLLEDVQMKLNDKEVLLKTESGKYEVIGDLNQEIFDVLGADYKKFCLESESKPHDIWGIVRVNMREENALVGDAKLIKKSCSAAEGTGWFSGAKVGKYGLSFVNSKTQEVLAVATFKQPFDRETCHSITSVLAGTLSATIGVIIFPIDYVLRKVEEKKNKKE